MRPFATTLMLSVLALSAAAAPVLPGEGDGTNTTGTSLDSSAPGAKSTGIIDRASATDVPNQSKTIEMLLEMQGKNPGLAGGERPRQEMPAGTRATISPPAAIPARPFGANDPTNPFAGPGLAPNKAPVAPQDSTVEWTEAPASRFGAGVLSSSGTPQRENLGRSTQAGGDPESDDMRWLIPRPVVRFVRQNRELVVIGSVVVLLLLWGATAVGSRRRK